MRGVEFERPNAHVGFTGQEKSATAPSITMTKLARFSYIVLGATLVLVGGLHLGAPLLALLFSYFVLKKLAGFIRNKWITLALFIVILAGIAYAGGHFITAAIDALPKIADKSIPTATAWAEAREINLPFTDFESLKTMATDGIKGWAHHLGSVANVARNSLTHLVFLIMASSLQSAFSLTVSSISTGNPTPSKTICTRFCVKKSVRDSVAFTKASPR
jgi:hypothetical protein